jgi:hypothetical protein
VCKGADLASLRFLSMLVLVYRSSGAYLIVFGQQIQFDFQNVASTCVLPLSGPTLSNLVAGQFLLFPHLATALTSLDARPLQELDNPLILIIEKKVSGMASIIPVLELALKVRSLKPAGSAAELA